MRLKCCVSPGTHQLSLRSPEQVTEPAKGCIFFAHIFSVNARSYKEICAVYNLVKIHARGWQARRLHTRKSTSLTRPYQEIYVPYM